MPRGDGKDRRVRWREADKEAATTYRAEREKRGVWQEVEGTKRVRMTGGVPHGKVRCSKGMGEGHWPSKERVVATLNGQCGVAAWRGATAAQRAERKWGERDGQKKKRPIATWGRGKGGQWNVCASNGRKGMGHRRPLGRQ